jgi:NAD-dependent dihydropyrimidine dehydrogenase PreA subunit
MTYVIAEPCIGVKDRSCVDVCPVDCIYEGEDQLYQFLRAKPGKLRQGSGHRCSAKWPFPNKLPEKLAPAGGLWIRRVLVHLRWPAAALRQPLV